jgi:hypothetical protein
LFAHGAYYRGNIDAIDSIDQPPSTNPQFNYSITRLPNYPIHVFKRQKSVTSTIAPCSTTLWSGAISM